MAHGVILPMPDTLPNLYDRWVYDTPVDTFLERARPKPEQLGEAFTEEKTDETTNESDENSPVDR